MKFNNRQNECVKTEDGRTVWLSRACAVVAHICLFQTQTKRWYVLLGQRGPNTPDFQGYWGLPCGYLDWDETLCEAMIREVWEECGLALPELSGHEDFVYSNNTCLYKEKEHQEGPWLISDKASSTKQNISFHYAVCFAWKGEQLPSLSNTHCEPGEVSELAWTDIEEAKQMSLAFNHARRIEQLHLEKGGLFRHIEDQVDSLS